MSKPIIGWARHVREKRFHAATELADSVATACNGRWEEEWTAEVLPLDQRPLFACGPCWQRALEQERAEAAIAEAERSGV